MFIQGFQGLLGIIFFLMACWLISENRKKVSLKVIITGLVTQIFLAVVMIEVPMVRSFFMKLGQLVTTLKEATLQGTTFVFGYIGGGEIPFLMKDGGNTFSLTFQALPMVFVVSAISMLLFYWQILPLVVRCFSWILQRIMGIGGALGVCGAAKIFLGQTEAPLLIRPYLNELSRSELFTVMTLGMATTSGTVMALYAALLDSAVPNVLSHILTASIISVPAAITLSRIMVPQTGDVTSGNLIMPYEFTSSMDAISKGASDGIRLFINIVAVLIVFVALVALLNKMMASLLPYVYGEPLTLQRILGTIMAPFTWLMGIPWEEAKIAGSLLGTKTILNEIYAFTELAKTSPELLSPHSRLIMVYALCGFANFSSIGIQIGGLGTMAPERRKDIISLGFKAVFAGTLSTMMSGTIVGLLSYCH